MRARFGRAANMAVEFLIRHDVRALPVNPMDMARAEGIALYTYSALAARCGVSADEICLMYGTADAFSLRRGDGYAIVFNNAARVPERVSWSICHEIGHCVLGHFTDFDVEKLDFTELAALDMEADAFAANVMAPICAFDMLKKPLREEYRQLFGLSRRGWEVRQRTVRQDRRRIAPCAARVLAARLSGYVRHGRIYDTDVESRVILGLNPEQRSAAYRLLENPMIVDEFWANEG